MRQWLRTLLLLLPLVLASGCATHHLWTESALDDWNLPAPKANLQLFSAPPQKDFLVVYDEYSYRHGIQKTRAYFLNQNEKRIAQKQAPHFVSTKLADKLFVVPVFYQPIILSTNQVKGFFAIATTNNQSFTLYSDGLKLGWHALPIYNDGVGKYERTALTPLTATADLTIIGGIFGYWYLTSIGGGDICWPEDFWSVNR